jgi:hypothetical protein
VCPLSAESGPVVMTVPTDSIPMQFQTKAPGSSWESGILTRPGNRLTVAA